MKPRHAAALVLVGWYLMVPPSMSEKTLNSLPVRDEELHDYPLSIFVIVQEVCSRTKFSRPPFRHYVVELVETSGTNESGATLARGHVREKVPAAPNAMLMQHECAGPYSVLTGLRLPLVTIPISIDHLHMKCPLRK